MVEPGHSSVHPSVHGLLRSLQHKISEPNDLLGDWHTERSVYFWHAATPADVQYAVERITGMLLARVAGDGAHGRLVFRGSTQGGGDARSVLLRFEAVLGERRLYRLQLAQSAARRWSSEADFVRDVDRCFHFWCSKLAVATEAIAWQDVSAEAYAADWTDTLAREAAAAQLVEDPAPIAALQREVLDGLRTGMSFFTASKEGGTHLLFDGEVFVRADYGEEPNLYARYSDEADMLACLRHFFAWDARQGWYPHHPPERDVWLYIRSQLRPRRA